MAQTGFDRLKPDQTISNRTQTGPDLLKPVCPDQTRTDRLKSNQTGPDRLLDRLKPDQTGTDRF